MKPFRHRSASCPLAISLFVAFVTRLVAGDGFLDPTFNPNRPGVPNGPDGAVLAMAVAPDDSILIVGNFRNVGSQASPGIARLKPDGTPDPTFHSPFPDPTHPSLSAITLASDGKIVVAGLYFVARLLADGSLDTTFKPAEGVAPYSPTSLAIDAEGRVLVGPSDLDPRVLVRSLPDGSIDSTFNPSQRTFVRAILPLPDGHVLVSGFRGLARLTESGAIDPAFPSTTDAPVYAMARLPDGRILIAGTFLRVGNVPRAGLARLLPDGTVDPDFDPDSPFPVEHIVAMPDGSAVLTGTLDTRGQQIAGDIARCTDDGKRDQDYPGLQWKPNTPVLALGRQSSGAIVCGGDFTMWGPIPRWRLSRLNPGGFSRPGFISIKYDDTTGATVFEGTPAAHATLSRTGGIDGPVSVWIADRPSRNMPATNGVHYVFTPHRVEFADGQAAVAIDIPVIDDKIPDPFRGFELFLSEPLGGADFTWATSFAISIEDNDFGASLANPHPVASELSGSAEIQLVRHGAHGVPFAVDVEFIPGTARPGIDYQPLRTRVNFSADANSAQAVVRIFDNGIADVPRTFGVRLHDPIDANHVAEPSEGTVTIHDNESPGGVDASFARPDTGKSFRAFYPLPDGSGIAAVGSGLIKLQPDFNVDAAFQPAFRSYTEASNHTTLAVAVWDDGRILTLEPYPRGAPSALLRLLADGSRDDAFPTNIVVGHHFTSLLPQGDGTFYVAADSIVVGKTNRGGLARFKPNGTLDTTFAPSVPNGSVNVLAVGASGKVYIAGTLSGDPGDPASYVARLLPDGKPDTGYHAIGKPIASGIASNRSVIYTMLLAPDGSVYLGGFFRKFGDARVPSLMRLRPDGDLDPSFVPRGVPEFDTGGAVIDGLALQSNGRLVVGGRFHRDNGGPPEFRPVAPLARLFPDGLLDPSFDCGVFGEYGTHVVGMRILDDGELLAGGTFDSIDGAELPSIARLYLEPPRVSTRPPRISGVLTGTDGTVRLRLAAPVAGRFVLESSDTLGNWQTLSTHDLVPAVLELTDTPTVGTATRFYRLHSAP